MLTAFGEVAQAVENMEPQVNGTPQKHDFYKSKKA